MAKTADTAKMADINDPAPESPERRDRLPPEQRTVAPTPDATKAQSRDEKDGVADVARKTAAEKAADARDAAASTASEQAKRFRQAGESFDEESFAHAATERLADNLSAAARSIRSTDLGHLSDDIASFARRQPLVFFGGAALLGFAAGRMVKASERAEYDADTSHVHDRRVSG
jgi:hypothetical protein